MLLFPMQIIDNSVFIKRNSNTPIKPLSDPFSTIIVFLHSLNHFMKVKNPHKQKIGILGGGQLGKMLCEAAAPWSLNIHILDKSKDYPAALVCPNFHTGDFRNREDVLTFGREMDILTIEIESVHTGALRQLEKEGIKVYPQAHILEIINDKGLQKEFYRDAGLPTSDFFLISSKEEILGHLHSGKCSFPFVQKLRKGGYDGRGVQIIRHEGEIDLIFDAPSVIEALVEIDKEIGLIIARNTKGEMVIYPAVEMVFHPTANLVEYLISPAQIPMEIMNQMNHIAGTLADALKVVGLLAIEFFVDKNGHVSINESAPRTHNSGHHTIEGNLCSQFEQQLRCILGLPFGSPKPIFEFAAMINLLGDEGYTGTPVYDGLEKILSKPNVYPHIYGKPLTKPFRKMGHITVTGDRLSTVKKRIKEIKKSFHIKSIQFS